MPRSVTIDGEIIDPEVENRLDALLKRVEALEEPDPQPEPTPDPEPEPQPEPEPIGSYTPTDAAMFRGRPFVTYGTEGQFKPGQEDELIAHLKATGTLDVGLTDRHLEVTDDWTLFNIVNRGSPIFVRFYGLNSEPTIIDCYPAEGATSNPTVFYFNDEAHGTLWLENIEMRRPGGHIATASRWSYEGEVRQRHGWGRFVGINLKLSEGSRAFGLLDDKAEWLTGPRTELYLIDCEITHSGLSHGIYLDRIDFVYINGLFCADAPRGKEGLKSIARVGIYLNNRMYADADGDYLDDKTPSGVNRFSQCGWSYHKGNHYRVNRTDPAQYGLFIGTDRQGMHGCDMPPRKSYSTFFSSLRGDETGLDLEEAFYDLVRSSGIETNHAENPFAFRHYVDGNKFEVVGDGDVVRVGLKSYGIEVTGNSDSFPLPSNFTQRAFVYEGNNEYLGFAAQDQKILASNVLRGVPQVNMPMRPEQIPWGTPVPGSVYDDLVAGLPEGSSNLFIPTEDKFTGTIRAGAPVEVNGRVYQAGEALP